MRMSYFENEMCDVENTRLVLNYDSCHWKPRGVINRAMMSLFPIGTE